jgi:exodeoxyribonuclease VII large subunit
MAQQPELPPAPPPDAAWSVSQLAARISGVVEAGLPKRIRVLGEISNFSDRTHWYFNLKDPGAIINCVMFVTHARRMRFTPINGQEIVVSGRVEFYPPQGRLTLKVDSIEPVGAGALELAFKALCDELRALGWFAPERKRPIPAFPRRIAIITSKTGAALQDVLDTMRRRCCAAAIYLVDVRVQGQSAGPEIARAIRWLGVRSTEPHRGQGSAGTTRPLDLDAILVTRGGGSMEDLWAFNERIVAQAIVESPVPIVAAIGHETDTTIAELVADLRCATPTQAAMRLTPDRDALTEQLDSLAARLRSAARRALRDRAQRTMAAARHPFMADPGIIIERERRHLDVLQRHLRTTALGRIRTTAHRLERLAGRLESYRPAALHARREVVVEGLQRRLAAAMRQRLAAVTLEALDENLQRARRARLDRAEARLDALARQLASVGPMSVLRRGFSYTLKQDGSLLRAPHEVRAGERIRTRLAEGEIASVVEGGDSATGLPTPVEAARPRPIVGLGKRRRKSSPNQMDLFSQQR